MHGCEENWNAVNSIKKPSVLNREWCFRWRIAYSGKNTTYGNTCSVVCLPWKRVSRRLSSFLFIRRQSFDEGNFYFEIVLQFMNYFKLCSTSENNFFFARFLKMLLKVVIYIFSFSQVLKKRREYALRLKDDSTSEESAATTTSPYREWLSKSVSSIPNRFECNSYATEQKENCAPLVDLNDLSSLSARYVYRPSFMNVCVYF